MQVKQNAEYECRDWGSFAMEMQAGDHLKADYRDEVLHGIYAGNDQVIYLVMEPFRQVVRTSIA